jgi:hypothetical protein
MSPKDTANVMRDLDVALSIFDVLENLLENNAGVTDLHYLSVLAGEGKRKLNGVVDVLVG